jgi:hypothetical protein
MGGRTPGPNRPAGGQFFCPNNGVHFKTRDVKVRLRNCSDYAIQGAEGLFGSCLCPHAESEFGWVVSDCFPQLFVTNRVI